MKTSSFVDNHVRTIVAISLFLIGIAGYLLVFGHPSPIPANEILSVERGTIREEVTVTGNTKAVSSANLAFERSGKITNISVSPGNTVLKGSLLASIDASNLLASLAEAKAQTRAQEAKLADLKAGARPEEIMIAEYEAERAVHALESATQNLKDTLASSYIKTDDAVRNNTDQLFLTPRSLTPFVIFSVSDNSLRESLVRDRIFIESMLTGWQTSLNNTFDDAVDLSHEVTVAKENLARVRTFLDNMGLAVNNLTTNGGLAQLTLDSYRALISSARSNIGTTITNLSLAEEKWQNAKSAELIAKNQLTLKRIGATPESIEAQTAAIDGAKAHEQSISAELQKTEIRAPFEGQITKIDLKLGEIASPNSPVITLISAHNLEIEVNLPEANLHEVHVGNPVAITFDAFPGETFSGAVASIDPAETVIQGVVNYKATVTLLEKNSDLKSGLTANLAIQTSEKPDALIIPEFAVIENDKGTFVRRIVNGTVEEIPVTLGIRSNDGDVEITSGVAEADKLLNIGLRPKN